MSTVLANKHLWVALLATMTAQLLKVILVLITERRWAFDRMLETGGMPSSHSAAVTSLATGIGLKYGWDSPIFALSAVFAGIVMYDATGIRRAAGIQAKLINELVKELGHLFDEGFKPQVLKTLLGHTYPQVLVGAIIGALIGLLFFIN
ncbi:MAG: divergent PAP2 family protein [Trueperaceae bacterium]|nr:divergent PAP2 family protein [Trueperaceae bacterium]